MDQGLRMRPRVVIARFLLRAGRFLQSLPVAIMRPKDLIAYSRHVYSQPHMVRMYSEPSCVESGLSPQEKELVHHLPSPPGRILLMGSGGGRDAIGLARLGFEVTALDFSPEQVRAAEGNARRHGVKLHFLVQDMNDLDLGKRSYDVVWQSPYLYSTMPTRKLRKSVAARIADSLIPGGILVCQFRYEPDRKRKRSHAWLKSAAWLTMGNIWYDTGDVIFGDREFIHPFASAEEVQAEVLSAGFESFHSQLLPDLNCGAILFKTLPKASPNTKT